MSKLQLIEELHRNARRRFPRRSFMMKGIDDTFQIDLIQFTQYPKENKNHNYILVVIDTFSKFAWTEPVKNKTGVCVTNAMQAIFKRSGHICKKIHSDNGKEFFNKHFAKLMKLYGIHHYATFSVKKASIVERLNRTLLARLWKVFNLKGNHRWIDVIQKVTHEYNNTTHRTIKMKPSEVTAENEDEILRTVYKDNSTINVIEKNHFEVGNFVRISKHKSLFEKGYTANWSSEVFKIRKIQQTVPLTYLLEDLNDQPIQGSFYKYELQKSHCPDVYLIEKVIRKNKDKSLVKWLGFDSSHNSYIDNKDIV